jgi:hypothetical protein
MKTLSTTMFCLLIAGITFSQRNGGFSTTSFTPVTTTNSNVSHSSTTTTHSTYTSPNTNTNSNSNWSNNSYNNNNYNSNSNYGGYNGYNNNNNNSSYYNNNSYNNGYYNNGSNSYNNTNSNYTTYTPKQSYQVTDDNYGGKMVTEDNVKIVTLSNPYNTSSMMSNYRNSTAIEKFFKQNQKPSQVFIINAQQENTVTGTGGTRVKIAPNSFVDKNGEVVKGDVEFEMKEMYTKSDMILSNAHTVCNDMPLKSGGEVFLGAERNGEPLILANDKPISVEIPATSQEPMQLFAGKPNRNTVNWNLANSTNVTPVANSNSSTGFSYNFTSANMNWLNCDKFMPGTSANTKVNVRLPQQYDTTNTAVFIVYRGQNTVTKFDGFTKYDGSTRMLTTQSMFDTKWYSVPQGSDVTIVAIAEINGQYYSSMDHTLIKKDHVADLVMTPTTLDQIKLDMEKLP